MILHVMKSDFYFSFVSVHYEQHKTEKDEKTRKMENHKGILPERLKYT
jgi:hypothetical protein